MTTSSGTDISAFIDSDTRIRFETVSGFSSNEVLFVDNVRIEMFSTPLTTTSLSPVKDTYIASGNPTDNFGSDNILRLDENDGSLGNGRVLMQFDLSTIPAGSGWEASHEQCQVMVRVTVPHVYDLETLSIYDDLNESQ